jgi:cytidyltransferase-like protein
MLGAMMSVLDVLKKYPEIELFSRDRGYDYYKLIIQAESDHPPLAYLLALGIPVYSALNLASKMVSDACRAIDTLIQSIAQKEYVGGNIQTLLVDFAEYGRSFMGLLVGVFVALYSPSYAAEKFLTIAADPTTTYLNPDEGARLYAMGDRLHAFFIKHKIDYRMCSGTALGAFREQGVIRNDDDIDLMLHPDSVAKFKSLFDDGTFTKETGIAIAAQEFTGGWQCFYVDSPKGTADSPLKDIGKPFVDIFPGTRRLLGDKSIITYGVDTMYLQGKGDHFSDKEWGQPVEYTFGPTVLYGIEPKAMKDYLWRAYGPTALKYVNRLYPHHVYTSVYANPLRAFSILAQHPVPRAMRHAAPTSLNFDQQVYESKIALSNIPAADSILPQQEEMRIWVDGIYDLFHKGHQNINKNAIAFALKKYPNHKIVLLIGICGDGEDVKKYKRQPIMTLAERYNAVDSFMKELIKKHPNVSYQLVTNSPVTHTLEFIQQHRLNILFHGSDFTPEKMQQYYGVIMDKCVDTSFEILPYTLGVSSTDLIHNLLEYGNFGDIPNTTGIPIEVLAKRVEERAEEFRHTAACAA